MTNNDFYKYKKPDYNKMLKFGFEKTDETYIYKTDLIDGDFLMTVTIDKDGLKTLVTEKETGDEYTLHLTDAEGTFIGQIRDEYNSVLKEIGEKCYNIGIFKFEYSYKVIDYVRQKYKDEIEYLWEKFPDNGIARRKDNKKWYLAILTVGRDKLGFDSEEKVEVIDLRADVNELQELTKQPNIFPGYHMNKKHWITYILDGSTDIEEIYKRIDDSYKLAGKRS
ncbi:MAG: MmcQ/YjbR family DNA-binding protein [Candidatus Gastranaerophilaceae bacterium]|jgi:predicted DNA-binding protein (MmcQ/YjbR family)|nr:MmcQ/YjbR family DNA-binding protein [Candidatus Gastranaerophilaceae bacterium]